MRNLKPNRILYILFISILFIFISCNNRRERLADKATNRIKTSKETQIKHNRITKVNFFIENSESMFGYVSTISEYVNVLSELAEKPEFVEEHISREFNLINGGSDVNITKIGSDPVVLKRRLNRQGFRCGDITKSNLNGMFQIALNSAKGDNIAILISDGIYDIGQPDPPFNALATEGKETRSKFIERLSSGNIQTIMIKLNSRFVGDYFYTSKRGKVPLNQNRPYYIWIFGESDLLNKYFPEEYISTKLNGYQSMARFLKVKGIVIPYQITSQNSIGRFKFDKQNNNCLIDAESDRNGQGFQISLAVDYSALPFPANYIEDAKNYKCNGNFLVKKVYPPVKKVYEVLAFKPSHLITLYTNKSPYGFLEVTLNNVIPGWIDKTNIQTENNIKGDTEHTFGFRYLTDAISEAYSYKNKEKEIYRYKVEIKK